MISYLKSGVISLKNFTTSLKENGIFDEILSMNSKYRRMATVVLLVRNILENISIENEMIQAIVNNIFDFGNFPFELLSSLHKEIPNNGIM
jgi:hypothetical protein